MTRDRPRLSSFNIHESYILYHLTKTRPPFLCQKRGQSERKKQKKILYQRNTGINFEKTTVKGSSTLVVSWLDMNLMDI